jgi:tetratricopeptide (TPR) repeat protein
MALIALAVVIAFGGAIGGPFQFDDVASIPRNPTIERLWPPSVPLHPPPRATVAGRPAVNVSLAINHAINAAMGVAQDPGGPAPNAPVVYRITNILIHLFGGLLLFGVIRRTAARVGIPETWSLTPDRLAAIVTVVWLIHPIQTEAVDYVIQRTELLVSVCYLGTLYASICAWDAETRRKRVIWTMTSVAACFVGMASKEVMASAPLAVILYDRAFRASSWRDLLRSTHRRWLYAGLVATLAVLVASIASGARSDSVGFGHGITWYEYLYSQAWAIARYLQLTLWPDRLVFDYGASPIRGLRGIPGLVLLSAAAIATALAWRRAAWIAFLGTAFFMLLAPSSSVVPIQTEIAAERRIYLALVPVLILAVVGIEALRQRLAAQTAEKRRSIALSFATIVALVYLVSSAWTGTVLASAVATSGSSVTIVSLVARAVVAGVAALVAWQLVAANDRRPVVVALIVVLTLRSAFRSRMYADAERLWRDAAAKIPGNPRAYDNLAAAIIQKDSSRTDEAKLALRKAISIDSTYLTGWTNLADIELRQGRTTEGRALLEHALTINPDFVDANERLGGVLVKLGDSQRGASYLERATKAHPTDESLGTLAIAYLALGRREEGKAALLQAVRINPRRADALGYLAAMFAEEGRPGDALGYVEAAIRAGATTPASYALLSYTYAQLQRPDDAARAAATAAVSAGDNATIFLQLGAAMTIAQRPADVEQYLTRAVEIEPRNPESITRLGLAKAERGKIAEAANLFRRALSVQPGYEPAQRALARVPAALQPK